MLQASWIWAHKEIVKDEYVRFSQDFSLNEAKSVKVKLSCDSIYNVWVNGNFVGFGMMYDYEHYNNHRKYSSESSYKVLVKCIVVSYEHTEEEEYTR